MRRAVLLLLMLSFTLLALNRYVAAQCAEGGCDSAENPPSQPVPLTVPIILEPLAPMEEVPIAADSCANATALVLPLNTTIAGITDMTRDGPFTSVSTDPDLSGCMVFPGTTRPDYRPQGYRTVWYRFTAPSSGTIKIEAAPNANYQDDFDTIVSLYQGGAGCTNIQRLTCSDDVNGLLSVVSHDVIQGEIYYIEIADRNLSVNGEARLNLVVTLEAINQWNTHAGWNMPTPVSRHVAVPVGEKIYVIGGETEVGDFPFETNPEPPTRTANVAVFDTVARTWDESLTPMPLECDFNGYSGTAGVYLNGRIHIPTGFVGDNQFNADTHCIYDIANDSWTWFHDSIPWQGNGAVAFASATLDPQLQFIYLVGGLRGTWLGNALTEGTTPSDEVYIYTNGFWLPLPNRLSVPRYSHAAAYVEYNDPNPPQRLICVVGGLNQNAESGAPQVIPDGECYDRTTSSWGPIGSLNVPRFNAGSFVGPDGTWYVVGGVGNDLLPVKEIEAFDVATRTWRIVDRRFELKEPAYGWPRGGFVDNVMWVIGGETIRFNSATNRYDIETIPEIVRADFPSVASLPFESYLPLVPRSRNDGSMEPNDTFANATLLQFGVSIRANFDVPIDDRFDVYYFDVPDTRLVSIDLTRIPIGHDYALRLFSVNKVLLAESDHINNSFEQIVRELTPGRYFVMVVADDKQPLYQGNYRLELR